MQNNDIYEIMNMERQDISSTVYHMLENFLPTSASVEKKLFHVQKTVGQGQKF